MSGGNGMSPHRAVEDERGRFVDIEGTRVFVESWGAGPPLLCIHGLGGGTHFFSTLGQALAPRYRTIALDLPGSGLSPAVMPFTFEGAARLVVDLAYREGAAPACLVGHSLGTIVALEAMRLDPGVASGFIAVGGLPEPLPPARLRLAARLGEVRERGLSGLGSLVARINFAALTLRTRPNLVAVFAKLFEMQSLEGYLATATALTSWQARACPAVAVPCLAVTGIEDSYAPPDAVRAFARTLAPGTDVVTLVDTAHLPFLEQPDAFADVVRSFLDRVFPAVASDV